MPEAAFLTLEDRGDFVVDDALAIAELARRGWDVVEVPWRRAVDWTRFACVVVRSTWDYQRAPDAFLAALERIADAGVRLYNPLEVIRWNLRKTYLRDLAARGVPVVPTTYGTGLGVAELRERIARGPCVIKPVVSANADDTFALDASTPDETLHAVAARFAGRAWMAQPFVPSVTEVGEFSLFYFGHQRSHAILKSPRPGDFRVQEEHGGQIRGVEPDADLVETADRVMAALHARVLQARVDLVRLPGGAPALMELELIEPSLYFRTTPIGAARFADALLSEMAR